MKTYLGRGNHGGRTVAHHARDASILRPGRGCESKYQREGECHCKETVVAHTYLRRKSSGLAADWIVRLGTDQLLYAQNAPERMGELIVLGLARVNGF